VTLRATVPPSVRALLAEREYVLLLVPGVRDSGLVLTNSRILAWRGGGIAPALALELVGSAQSDRGLPQPTLVVAPDVPDAIPIVLLLDPARRRMADKLLNVLPGVLTEFERSAGREIGVERVSAGDLTSLRFIRPRATTNAADG
jgi:hypothetical protein